MPDRPRVGFYLPIPLKIIALNNFVFANEIHPQYLSPNIFSVFDWKTQERFPVSHYPEKSARAPSQRVRRRKGKNMSSSADMRPESGPGGAARHRALAAAFAAGLIASFTASVGLAEAAPEAVGIELNKLEPNGDACRAYVVLNNTTAAAYGTLKLDLVLFDADGIVVKRLAVETAPLAAGKTSLKVFDIDGLACGHIGRMLLNDVIACDKAGKASDDCMDGLTPTARGSVPFIK